MNSCRKELKIRELRSGGKKGSKFNQVKEATCQMEFKYLDHTQISRERKQRKNTIYYRF